MKENQKIRNIRRKNAKLFPIYKMFSWDLLCFYSIEYLFYTITKQVTASEILIIHGFCLIFRLLMQIPAVTISDFFGKRNSIILGNALIVAYTIALMVIPGATGIIIANLIFALGYDIKIISETNLLYDSVATKGGEGLYSKLDTRGGSWYYVLDGITSLTAGYLFVINNYLPIIICLTFAVISTIISFKFENVYDESIHKEKNKGLITTLKEYKQDLKVSFKFMWKSQRMKAFVLFQIVFFSLIEIIDTYKSDLLTDLGVPEEQFSMIFAVLTLMGAVSLSLKSSIEKKFKNRTLAFISLAYIGACIIVGVATTYFKGTLILPIILVMYAVFQISSSIWYILEYKYLKNFTTEDMRNRLTFAFEFIGGIAASIFSILGGLLLNVASIQNAFLLVGLIALVCMVLTLDYMRKRFGLTPSEYKKEDLEFENN